MLIKEICKKCRKNWDCEWGKYDDSEWKLGYVKCSAGNSKQNHSLGSIQAGIAGIATYYQSPSGGFTIL